MDEKKELHGWLAASRNLRIDCLGEYVDLGVCGQYCNLLNKFPQDQIFISNMDQICFLNGYVYNKEEFLCPEGFGQWPESFSCSLRKDRSAHFLRLRGAFCGYFYDKVTDQITIYTDHVSNKALYYYADGDRWILSNYVDFMVRVMRANGIPCRFDRRAAEYMLTYGYMLDDCTYIKEIRRLLPGCYATITEHGVSVTKYYKLARHEQSMTEDEALERLDRAFRQAVTREFEKDREYGYRHLVDLSAGLDSRMVCWAAHDLGYTEQTNMSYSRLGYKDDVITGRMAKYLRHEYLFRSLDDVKWMYDVDEMTLKNNGAAICHGMTGGNRMLKTINTARYGIEHTGILGGAILAGYYRDRTVALGKPRYGLNVYSEKLRYAFDDKLLEQYETQETFAVNTRGLLGMQVSYMIRQNYMECASPFGDVDMLEAAFSIPFEYRVDDKLYLRWIAEKYPQAAEFGWEKWGGVKPKKSHIFFRKVKTTQRLANSYWHRLLHLPESDSMNPMDYWYREEKEVRSYLDAMYEERIESATLPGDLADDMRGLYQNGNFVEKSLVLTVLSAVYLYFDKNTAAG